MPEDNGRKHKRIYRRRRRPSYVLENLETGKIRRSRHPGIYKRLRKDGSAAWEVRAYEPARRKTVPIGTFESCEAARKAKREFEAKRATKRGSVTVAAYAERWLSRKTETTRRTHTYAIDTLLAAYGDRPIGALDWTELRMWAYDQPPWRAKAVRALLNAAIVDGVATENPAARLDQPQSRGRRDIVPIAPAEVELLARIAVELYGPAYGTHFATMIKVAAWTGMRPSELFALRWEWIDFAGWEISVRGQLERNGDFKSLTKTRGQRPIVLPPPGGEALRALPRRIDAEEIFRTKRDRKFSLSKLHYYWHPVRTVFETRIGPERLRQFRDSRHPERPDMDFYELRHFCATYLLDRGLTPSDVGKQLGCSERKVIEVYGHPSDELARQRIKNLWRKRPDSERDDEDQGPAGAPAIGV